MGANADGASPLQLHVPHPSPPSSEDRGNARPNRANIRGKSAASANPHGRVERRVRLTTSYKSLDSFGLGNKRLMVSQLPATRDYTLGHTEPRGRVHTVQDGGLDVSRAGGRPGGWADGGSGGC